jgi:hypothetical protein
VQKEPEVLYNALKPSEYAELSFFLARVPQDERRSVGLSSALIVELVRPAAAPAQPPSLTRFPRIPQSRREPGGSDAEADAMHSRGLRRRSGCLAGSGEAPQTGEGIAIDRYSGKGEYGVRCARAGAQGCRSRCRARGRVPCAAQVL